MRATVAIGTTLMKIALMIAFLRESTANGVDGETTPFGDYDRVPICQSTIDVNQQ
jgi:hypothetical protein